MKRALACFWFFASIVAAQQPQTQLAPIYPVNAKYVQGAAPGYWPTTGSGLTLNLAAGTANCGGTVATYSGGTLTMTASTTNYVYLDTSSSCAPAVKSTTFTSADIPIAVVVASGSSITSITDDRTMFNKPGAAGTVVSSINGAPGSFTFTGPGVSCTGTTCTFTGGGGGVTSLNSLTGALSLTSSDSTIAITPIGSTINLTQGSSGPIAASYPANTRIFVFTDSRGSIAGNDSHACAFTGGNTVTGVVASSGTLTVTYSTAGSQSAGDDLTLYGFSGGAAVLNGVEGVIGSTGLTSSTFLITGTSVPNGTYGAGFYGCTYNSTTRLATSPLLPSTSDVKMNAPTNATMAIMNSNYASMVHPFSPAVTGKPGILIIEAGVGCFLFGSGVLSTDVASCESGMQTLWATAHTDAWQVYQETVIPYSPFSTGAANAVVGPATVNTWLRGQAKGTANVSSGQYYDQLIMTASDLSYPLDDNVFIQTSPAYHLNDYGNALRFGRLNAALLTRGTFPTGQLGRIVTDSNTNNTALNLNDTAYLDTPNTWMNTQYVSDWRVLDSLSGNTSTEKFVTIVYDTNGPKMLFRPVNLGGTVNGTFYTFPGGGESVRNINPKDVVNCFTPTAGSTGVAPTVCMSIDGTTNTQIDVSAPGSPNAIGADFGVRNLDLTGYLIGAATAPSGACSPNGAWEFTQDGAVTKCIGAVWVTFGAASPLTAKGDLYTHSTVDARLAVGTNGQLLSADSSQPTGLSWINAPSGSFSAGGDLSGTSTSQTVGALKGVPFCSGYTPTAGQIIVYTTSGTPNPCYAAQNAPSGSFSAGGDLAGTSSSQQVKGINGVPLCTGFTPTTGQNLQYTTASSPNPCYTAATPSSGYPTPITLTASNSAELDFTTCISSTYRDYELRFSDVLPATASQNLFVQVSTNGGSTYDTTSGHYVGGGAQAGVRQSVTLNGFTNVAANGFYMGGYGSSSGGAVSGKLNLFNLPNSTAAKRATELWISDGTPDSIMNSAGYVYNQTAAVNAIRVIAGSGNITSGTVTCQPLPQ